MLTSARHQIPHLRVVRALNMRGHPYRVDPFRAIIYYDGTAAEADARCAVRDALILLWDLRNRIGATAYIPRHSLRVIRCDAAG